MPSVAFLGLGAIGAPMARQLARSGFDPRRLEPHARPRPTPFARRTTGARQRAHARPTPRAAPTSSITCLPTSRDVDALLDGPDGLLAGLQRGALVVDCTSGDPGDLAADRRAPRRAGDRLPRRAGERRA